LERRRSTLPDDDGNPGAPRARHRGS
jgi:hypothetical protein